jgi:hypothetical protein
MCYNISFEFTSSRKKQNITIGDTCAFFLLGSQSSEDLGAMVVASSKKTFNKIKCLDFTCFFMVVMSLIKHMVCNETLYI